jgi:hypothetical protein
MRALEAAEEGLAAAKVTTIARAAAGELARRRAGRAELQPRLNNSGRW